MSDMYGNPDSSIYVIRLVGEHEKDTIQDEVNLINEKVSYDNWCMVTVPVKKWSYEMTPWKNSSSSDEGGAPVKIDEILSEVIPRYFGNNRKFVLAGYSLAGLFSLWVSYQTDVFEGIVAGSPSVWYPGWDEYIADNVSKAEHVYLSLGSKEHKIRNKQMAIVKDAINLQHEKLKAAGVNTTLEINPGNHFVNVTERMAKGISWILENMR